MSSALATSSLKLPVSREKRKIATDSLLLSGAIGLLLFCPLAFGAVEPWAIFVLEASTVLLFVLWVWTQAATNELKIRDNPLFRPMLAYGAVVVVQLVFAWTAYRHDTFSQASLYLAYGLLAFLAGQCLRRSAQAKTLAVVISAYGVARRGLRSPAGPFFQRQVVLDSYTTFRRLDLRALRQSQPLRRADGDARPGSARVLPDALRGRAHSRAGRGRSRPDGCDHFFPARAAAWWQSWLSLPCSVQSW